MLLSENLSNNIRNAVIMRRGEKQVLHYYIDFCDWFLSKFDLPAEELLTNLQQKEDSEIIIKFGDNYTDKMIALLEDHSEDEGEGEGQEEGEEE